jgi:hypothetical protein
MPAELAAAGDRAVSGEVGLEDALAARRLRQLAMELRSLGC